MIELSGDPYEGAHQAFKVVNPEATSQDWEDWVGKTVEGANGDFDNFKAFARLCIAAASPETKIDRAIAEHIAYAAGYFEAMAKVVASLIDILPVSSCTPHHEQRYRKSLLAKNAQFA